MGEKLSEQAQSISIEYLLGDFMKAQNPLPTLKIIILTFFISITQHSLYYLLLRVALLGVIADVYHQHTGKFSFLHCIRSSNVLKKQDRVVIELKKCRNSSNYSNVTRCEKCEKLIVEPKELIGDMKGF